MISPLFIFLSFIWFTMGAAVGSFLNVLIYRSISGEQWVKGRSHCDFCHQPLSWYDNIPLLSFYMLQGKTRCCGKFLSISHPVVEFLIGSLFLWWYWGGTIFFQLTQAPFTVLQPLFWLIVGILLILVLVIDWVYMIIPDVIVVILLLLSLVYRVILTAGGIMQGADFINSLLAAAGSGLFFWLLWKGTKGKGLGFGDVKFVVPMALLVGWPSILVALMTSFVVGAMVGVGMLVAGKAALRKPIPFGPFLVTGTIVAVFYGNQILSWYIGTLMN